MTKTKLASALDYIQILVKKLPTANEKICFAMGYDCEMNGADTKNCHFSLFSTKENTAAWEAGKAQAHKEQS